MFRYNSIFYINSLIVIYTKIEVGDSKWIMNIVNKQFSIMVTSRTPKLVPEVIECFRLSILRLGSLFVKKWEIFKNSLHVKHNDLE